MPKKGFFGNSFEKEFEKIQKSITDKIQDLPGDTVLDKVFYFESHCDKQFLSLEKLSKKTKIGKLKTIGQYENIFEYIMFLVIQNSLICYQLSGTGEDYREEFSKAVIVFVNGSPHLPALPTDQAGGRQGTRVGQSNFFESEGELRENNLAFWKDFLKKCKNNRRLNKIKLGRIQKSLDLRPILSVDFFGYYKDMNLLLDMISKIMNQKINAKTVVFSIKMFSYVARVVYDKIIPIPFDIEIPIDSRILSFYQEVNGDMKNIKNSEVRNFYTELSKYLEIPPLHLDALLWVR